MNVFDHPVGPMKKYLADQKRLVLRCLPRIRHPELDGPWFHPDHGSLLWFLGEDIKILSSVEEKSDGNKWYHVSFSRADRIPSYEDMALIRDTLFRPTSVVLQVFPPREEHFNFHPHTLHLWERVTPPEERVIPDLRILDTDGSKGI